MNFYAKTFDELSPKEIYEILKARMEVFLLEQHIVCLDIDGVDYDSLHVFIEHEGRVEAYFRAFRHEDAVKIGRVLTREHGKGLGRLLMEQGIEAVKAHFSCDKIILHSQKYAEGFYKKLGFETVSDEYLEEGVVHVTMELGV
ncbi:MAG: GNAT family N-acetyltransferase [Ruminococcaceae bacterium]|nr:GNAT family N-acetyltransferase [Oscillospiraceae bacterium]